MQRYSVGVVLGANSSVCCDRPESIAKLETDLANEKRAAAEAALFSFWKINRRLEIRDSK